MCGGYFAKLEKLQNKGVKKRLILPFEESIYNKLNNFYMSNIPLSFHLKYLNPISGVGNCYERTIYTSFAFNHFQIKYGLPKDLVLREGKENAGHYWLEVTDENYNQWVYDASHMMKCNKRYYYKMYKPKKIITITDDEFRKSAMYERILNSKVNQIELLNVIPLLEGIAKENGNLEFMNCLEKFKKQNDYDSIKLNKLVNSKLKAKIG